MRHLAGGKCARFIHASNNVQEPAKSKELQLSASIDLHDLGIKGNHAIEFLGDDMKVRVKMRYRGRQKFHKEVGLDLINRFVMELALYGQADAPPKMLGDRDLNAFIGPLP